MSIVSGWLVVSLHYCKGLNGVMDWKVHIEELELNDTQELLLYCDCDLMDENISVMNKYSEPYNAAVRSLIFKTANCMSTYVQYVKYSHALHNGVSVNN
jgi:hypothetical protein